MYVVTVNVEPVATLRPYSDRDIAGMERGHAAAELGAIERLAASGGEAWLAIAEPGDGGADVPSGRGRRTVQELWPRLTPVCSRPCSTAGTAFTARLRPGSGKRWRTASHCGRP